MEDFLDEFTFEVKEKYLVITPSYWMLQVLAAMQLSADNLTY